MPREPLTSAQVLALLREHPPRIAALTADLTPAQLRRAPGPDEWSANDVLAHLRSCADVWGNCIHRILDEDTPAIRAVSPRGWITRTSYPELDFGPSFREFEAQRGDLVSRLSALPPRDWLRTARVTRSGKVVTETVLSFAGRLAEHERHHLEQFARIARTIRGQRSTGGSHA